MHKITGAEYAIKKIFSDDFDFLIPPYQRPYAWTTEEAGELFDDLQQFMIETKVATDGEPYFLGSIVLIKTDGVAKAEVIDGQQRLTTLTILLAALVDKLQGKESESLAKYINEPGDLAEELAPKPRLALRARDADFFREYVQTEGKLRELIKLDPEKLTDPRKNILHNAKLYLDKTGGMSEEETFELGKFMVNRCFLVAVTTPTMQSAYRIFSVLNDRGLDLLSTDILKSEIIGVIAAEKQDAYTVKWEETEDELGRDAFSDLFSHIRMIYRKAKPKKTMLDEFREYVLMAEDNSIDLIDGVIRPYADAYQVISEAAYESTEGTDEVNDHLRWLLRIDNSDWVPPALVYMKKHSEEPAKLARFFNHLERLAGSMFIRRHGVNERIDRYSKLLTTLEAGDGLWDADSHLMLSDEEKEKTVEALKGDIYLMNKRLRTYVLLRLDSWVADRGATYDHKRLTVEHVLPQTVTEGGEWEKTWPDEEKRKSWVHKLGNLLLLTRNKNSSASNWDFDIKKTKYFQTKGGVSSFAITTTVIEKDEWTEAVVSARQDEMIGKLKMGWNL